MRTRTAITWTAHRVRLTVGWGLATMLVCVALSACSGSSTSPASVYSTTPSGATSSATGATSSATGTASASTSESPANEIASPPSSPPASVSESPSPEVITSSPEFIPTQAPITGGGGTAGFQDAGLALLGGAAIVAGLASIAYRRRMTRNR